MKKIAILGSTGSIGTQTLEIVRENKDLEVTSGSWSSRSENFRRSLRRSGQKRRQKNFGP